MASILTIITSKPTPVTFGFGPGVTETKDTPDKVPFGFGSSHIVASHIDTSESVPFGFGDSVKSRTLLAY